MADSGVQRSLQGATLVDLLDRILDKGLVVAGDVVVQLADVELLTIKIRLIVCSVDKAQEIGMDWWKHDTFLSSSARPMLDAMGKKEKTEKLFSQRSLRDRERKTIVPKNTTSRRKKSASIKNRKS